MHVRLQIAEIARGVGPPFDFAQENQSTALQGRDVARIVVGIVGIIDGVCPGAHGTVLHCLHPMIFIVSIRIFHRAGEATTISDLDKAQVHELVVILHEAVGWAPPTSKRSRLIRDSLIPLI